MVLSYDTVLYFGKVTRLQQFLQEKLQKKLFYSQLINLFLFVVKNKLNTRKIPSLLNTTLRMQKIDGQERERRFNRQMRRIYREIEFYADRQIDRIQISRQKGTGQVTLGHIASCHCNYIYIHILEHKIKLYLTKQKITTNFLTQ